MIMINDIIKTYGRITALKIHLLMIEQNEICGIIGNNGAGKTTMLKAIIDLIKLDKGCIKINGVDVSKSENWKIYTSAFIDTTFLIDYLTPIEYFQLIGYYYMIDQGVLYENIEKYKQFLGLDIFNNKKMIREHSSGEQNKIGIIGAMIVNPALLLLDEPNSFLDPNSQILLKKHLSSYQQAGGTILLSSHNINLITEICTKILLLEKGNVIEVFNVDELTISKINKYFQKSCGLPAQPDPIDGLDKIITSV